MILLYVYTHMLVSSFWRMSPFIFRKWWIYMGKWTGYSCL